MTTRAQIEAQLAAAASSRQQRLAAANEARAARELSRTRYQDGRPSYVPPSLEAGRVLFETLDGKTSVEAWLRSYPKPLADRFGGFQPVTRDGDTAVVEFVGQGVAGRVVTILFDDWVDAGGVREEWETWLDMCDATPPPDLRVTWAGQSSTDAERYWVIGSMEPGDEVLIADDDHGTLMRRDATVTILNASRGKVVRTDPVKAAQEARRARRPSGGLLTGRESHLPGRVVRPRSGDTLQTIAARELLDASLWRELTTSPEVHDPTQTLKPETKVTLP